MIELGLFGLGRFGCFLAKHLAPFCTLTAFDPAKTTVTEELPVRMASLAETAAKDVVVLSVPVQNLEEVLREIRPYLKPGALVLDVASVKVHPARWLTTMLPQAVEVVATHPLFGPQSAKDGIEGLTIVLCPLRTSRAGDIADFCSSRLGLKVVESTPEAHDREVAFVQALTHFLSRGVREMGLGPSPFATPAYQHMLAIGDLLRHDTEALFETIEKWNPYACEERRRLLDTLQAIHNGVGEL